MGTKEPLSLMTAFLSPKSIVLVGASANPRSLGFTVARALIRHFRGRVHYVSATEAKVLGSNTYATINDIPSGSHLWIFAALTKKLPEVLHQISKRRPLGVLLLMEIHESIKSAVAKAISRFSCTVIGPRSAGYYAPTSLIDTIILPPEMLSRPPSGATGVITDNRDVAFGLIEHLSRYRCGVSMVIDLGDSLGINETNALSFLVKDPSTRVILFGCGQISQIRKFENAVKHAQHAKKPIIVPLFTPEITENLGLHRRKSTGITRITNEMAIQHHLITTTSWGRAVDLAKLAQWQPLPKGPGVAVVSNFGPYCVNAASSLHLSNLKLAPLEQQTLHQIKDALPPYCRAVNPICLYTNADEVRMDTILRIMLPDSSIHILMLSLLPNSPFIDPDYLSVMLRQRLSRADTKKTVVGIIPAVEPDNLLVQSLEKLQIPVYSNPHRAVSTLEKAYQYASSLKIKNRSD